jgi:formylglycine-generating enzyme required for sulfatase activity
MVFIAADTMPSGLKPFWLDRTEVTTEAFEKCIESGACHYEKARHPINCVNYHEASRYCAQMGKYLPNTQQWDFAARGNRTMVFPWGDTMLATDALCWHRRAGSCPVDQYPGDISPFGVLGMGANVGEWTSTKFYPDPELSARVFRGWSWGTEQVSEFFKSHGLPAEKSQNNIGFRCAKDVSAQD